MDHHIEMMRVLQFMLDGKHDSARGVIRHMSKEQLQKLSDALDYYAVLVDEQLIRNAQRETN